MVPNYGSSRSARAIRGARREERVIDLRSAAPEPARLGDFAQETYDRGFELGARWAASLAAPSEIGSLAEQVSGTWFVLTFRKGHSLIEFLSEEIWDCEPPSGRVRLHRDPMLEGTIAGALLAAQRQVAGRLER